ncbi:MAG: DUF5996 family protein [Pseudomonadota bacterium]|uniref:DUF5996 family protein n=1 Tax=Thermithiobacillus tepidarius TaxID=929 RepID=UPI0004042E37|nr:DUF5996 family protein [Thermithiobacillus tepidarius]
MGEPDPDGDAAWPELPLPAWQETYATLHMWMQVVGKIRLRLSPMLNHWWQVPLYVTARGLTTSPMPYGARFVQIDFDFLDHRLRIDASDGARRQVALMPRSVADFHAELMAALHSLGIEVRIWTMPVEVPDPTPFEHDHAHAAYDAAAVQRFWRVLLQAERRLQVFRARFLGKCSPVHFFWGSFDLAVTRFSGRRAPVHPGVPGVPDAMVREAYSHELSSCGFWPGGGPVPMPAFYSYAYPEPPGFRAASLRTASAYYSPDLGEFILPYDAVRHAREPGRMLLDFCQETYEAAAELGHWDRAALERTAPVS